MQQRIFLVGLMGSGKSYWARHLSEWYGVPWFDTDTLISEQAGMTISELFDIEGETSFRQREFDVLRKTPWPDAAIIATGGGLPCFHGNMDWMLENGRVLWLNPPPAVIGERIWRDRQSRPLLKQLDDSSALISYLEQLHRRRSYYYSKANGSINHEQPVLQDMAHAVESIL